jgi:diguanylate cyclase (GGDEF)-like protein
VAYEITHDEVTGLLNRNSIVNVLVRNIEQSLANNLPLAIALVQIDSRYAHSLSLEIESAIIGGAADSIAGAAHNALRSVRAYDAIGRFGEDSFLAIFPGVGGEAATNLAMRLLAGLNRQTSLVPVAANIGIATTDGASDASVDNLIQGAEKALALATQRGPNRIEFATLAEGLILPSHRVESVTH